MTEANLVTVTDIALGQADVSACPPGDANHDGRITVDEIVQAVPNHFGQCALSVPGRTLDDLFEAVALSVPDFGGMFLAENEQVLQVYLLDPSPENVAAVTNAITAVFGQVIPQGGIHALPGQYGFLQLRNWYRTMAGRILSTAGVTATDINEAVNRLVVGTEAPEVAPQILQVLTELGIPRDAVAIAVTGPIEPLSHTLRDVQSPRQGGYQIVRLINNTTGFGINTPTLGFNAARGGIPGIVTNSHNSQVFWNLDTNAGFPPADFYQAPGYFPSELIATESVDPQGFPCAAPYPAGYTCRYSDSIFADYKSGVAWDPGVIAKTTGPTVLSSSTANLILSVDHSSKFTVVAPPSQPYLVGLQLHKVGRTTGWTTGAIQYAYFPSTCADFVDSQHRVRLCQYTVTDTQQGLATFGDSGSPVFRVIDSQCGYVELYGLVWGGGNFFIPPAPWTGGSVGKMFVFSPIGGVSFQQTGVQSAPDLGALSYTAAGTCNTPTPTPTVQPCGFVGPRMCGGSCPNSTDVCQPLPDDSGCVCQPGAGHTPTPTTPQPTFTGTLSPAATPTATPTVCVSGPLPNLVLNPGFESFASIPTGLSQLNLAISWVSPTNASPDYFHSLATASSGVGVPGNTFGSESAHGGRAYAGFHARPSNAYREYVEGSLSSPLIAGKTYQVSFYVSLADGSRWAIDKLGAYFSVGPVGPVNTAYNLALTPQIALNGYATNKTGWTQILGSYTAAGGEDHIVIGNFLDNPSTTPLTGQGGSYDFAYYYVDDVSASLLAAQCTPTPTGSPTRTPTATLTPTAVATCPPGVVCTPTPTLTRTATPSLTRTPSASSTRTATASSTPTPSQTPPGTPTCVTPPPHMVAWWPLDEGPGSTSVADIGSPPPNTGQSQPGPIGVTGPLTVPGNLVASPPDTALLFYTPNTYVEVPAGSDLDLANADLTIDAWVGLISGPWSAGRDSLHVYSVVDKLDLAGTGHAFYVQVQTSCPTCPPPPQQPPPSGSASTMEMRLVFVVGTGSGLVFYTSGAIYSGTGTVFSSPAPPSVLTPQPPPWMHVAVTVDRAQSVGKFYFGGNHILGSDFVPATGINNGNPVWLGGTRLYGSPQAPAFTEFKLNEIELFDVALSESDLQGIADANGGKCKGVPTPARTTTSSPTVTRSPSAARTRTATPTATQTLTPRPDTGSITILKNTVPDGPQDFSFAATGGLVPSAFVLDDDADPTLPNAQAFTNVPLGTYTISETVPAGWTVTSIGCAGAGSFSTGVSSVTITVQVGTALTCTFKNEPRPTPTQTRTPTLTPSRTATGTPTRTPTKTPNGLPID